jgi:hypothetical protein
MYKGMWVLRGFSRVKIVMFCEKCTKSGEKLSLKEAKI